MKSSRSVGLNRRLSGKSLLTFTSLLVVMFSAPVFGEAQFEGTMWGFTKKDKDWAAVSIVPKEEARDTFKEAREKALELLSNENGPSTADVKEALTKFTAKDEKTKNEFVVMSETLLDAFKKVTEKVADEKDKEAKIQKIVDAVKEAVNDDPEAFGHNWSKIRNKKELNAAGIKMLVEELAKLYKEGKFPTSDKEMNALLKKLFKNTDLLEKLGLTAKKPEDKKKEKPEDEDKDKNAKKKDEEDKNKNEEDKNKNANNNPPPVPPGNNPVPPELPGVNCAPNNQNDLLTKFLMDNLQNLAKQLNRNNDAGQEALNLADALNGRRNDDQGQAQQPAQSPVAANQPEQRRDEQPQESLAKDTTPQREPDPSFGDPGVPPIVMNGGVRKPEYKKVAEDGSKEKNALASEIANAKSADKKADSFMNSLGTLASQMFLPNGQLNQGVFSNALMQTYSLAGKLTAQANNLKSELDAAKARRDALQKEIKKANPELARSEEAEKTLKELTNAEQTLTQALQTKSSQCNNARLPEERQACDGAKQSITNSLQQLKQKKNEQQELITKSDKNFEEGYVADLKENLTQLESSIKTGEARLSDVEDKADKLNQQAQQLQANAAQAMYPAQTGSTTRDKITAAGGGRRPGAFGGVMGSASGTGRGSYAPGSKGKF